MPIKSTGASSANRSVLSAVIAVILAVAGFAAGYATGSSRANDAAKAEGYREALESAKAKLGANGVFAETRITSLRGTVKAVSGDSMDIEVGQTVTNPLADQAPLVRHVTLAKDAVVVRSVPKSDAVMFTELADYEKAASAARQKGTPPPAAPVSYTVEKISLGDLKAGDTVIVEAQDDIARAATFAATSVRTEVRPAVPTPTLSPNSPAPSQTPPPSSTAPAPANTPPPSLTPPPPAKTAPPTPGSPTPPPPPATNAPAPAH